nr:hypothetical protein HmN_001013800 [Hymenolepis microstoma]
MLELFPSTLKALLPQVSEIYRPVASGIAFGAEGIVSIPMKSVDLFPDLLRQVTLAEGIICGIIYFIALMVIDCALLFGFFEDVVFAGTLKIISVRREALQPPPETREMQKKNERKQCLLVSIGALFTFPQTTVVFTIKVSHLLQQALVGDIECVFEAPEIFIPQSMDG